MKQYILKVNGHFKMMSNNKQDLENLKTEILNHWKFAQKEGGRRDTGKPEPVFEISPYISTNKRKEKP